ncbi:MAG: AI-2E family transporter [Saprospiraceae bacterium]|nr:AI-2E family transporter [Saprospiraceae bacterium]
MKRNAASAFFLVLLFAVTLTFFGLIKDYLLAVFWAVVLALLFRTTQDKILMRVRHQKNLAAGLTLMGIVLIVILPLFFIGYAVTGEAIAFYNKIDSGEINIKDKLDNLKNQWPVVEGFLERLNLDVTQIRSSFNEAIANASKALASSILNFTQNIIGFLIQLFIMLYILFFFLRDGRELVKKLVWVLPIGDDKEWALIRRFESVARATVKGSLVVAMTQGIAGGLLFAAVGIPGAVLWGVLMTIVSLLPLGSGVIWLPAAIILFAQGEITRAVVVFVVGALIIGLLDNFLRPRLVGNDTKMPDYLILLSTLGGLAWVGISGFVLGPIIAAFLLLAGKC